MHFCDVADCPKYCWSKVNYGLCVGECISSSPLTAHYCIWNGRRILVSYTVKNIEHGC